MKVAHVVRQYVPSVGGIEEVVRNLVAYQARTADYQPCVITLDRVFRNPQSGLPRIDVVEGVPVHRLPYSGSERYPLCPRVLLSLSDIDLVHVHGIDFLFDFLALTKPIHRKPLVASTHGGFFHTPFAQTLKRVFFNTITRTNCLSYQRVIATSNNDGDIFSRVSKAPRLVTIENGVDITKFHNASSLTLKSTMVYFGRWSVNKGLLDSLLVFSELCLQQPEVPWQFVIAGREYDLTAQDLLDRASALGIRHRVKIQESPSNAEIIELLATASYFICMSKHEGFGIAPIEAMSAGLQPLLSSIPPFEQLVRNTKVGLVLQPTPPATQAAQIAAHYIQTAQLTNNQYSAARSHAITAVQPFSWEE